VRKESPIVTEASLTPKKGEGRIVELGVEADDFQEDATATETAAPTVTVTEESGAAPAAGAEQTTVVEEAKPAVTSTALSAGSAAAAPPLRVTTYAQLLSTTDQKTAETLAAKLIDRGFTAAYVERGTNEKGPIYRVRVKFDSETDARAAEPKLRAFSNEVWITTK
jgi:hypothetical protein